VPAVLEDHPSSADIASMKTPTKIFCLLSFLLTSFTHAATLKLTVNLKGVSASEFTAPRVHFTSSNPLCKIPGLMMPGMVDREEDFYAEAPKSVGPNTLEMSIPLTYPKGNFCKWKLHYVVLETKIVGSTFAFYSDLKKPVSSDKTFDLISNAKDQFGSDCKVVPKPFSVSYGYECKDYVLGAGNGEVTLLLKNVKLPKVVNRTFDIAFEQK
jgi:hypothetical protein